MNVPPACRCLLAILAALLVSQESQGVIVAGTSGTGYNNNTKAGLDSHLSVASQAPFPYWQNLVRVSNASGVYLGFNPDTMRGWVLSADHINPYPTSIAVAGNAYSVVSRIRIGTSDLVLYQIGGGMSDPALPELPSVPLASALATDGQYTLMFGRGFTNSTTAPFPWVNPGSSDANGMRWGTNTVLDTASSGGYNYVVTDFSASAAPTVTAYEAQGALGDSGGGLFTYRGGQWELSGIASGVTRADFAYIGDETHSSDVFSSRSSILGFTGTLIPEPSSLWFALTGVGLLWRRQR